MEYGVWSMEYGVWRKAEGVRRRDNAFKFITLLADKVFIATIVKFYFFIHWHEKFKNEKSRYSLEYLIF